MVFLWFSYGFSHKTTIFLWFSYGFSHKTTIFLWFSYGFPMVFLWFTRPPLRRWVFTTSAARAALQLSQSAWISAAAEAKAFSAFSGPGKVAVGAAGATKNHGKIMGFDRCKCNILGISWEFCRFISWGFKPMVYKWWFTVDEPTKFGV